MGARISGPLCTRCPFRAVESPEPPGVQTEPEATIDLELNAGDLLAVSHYRDGANSTLHIAQSPDAVSEQAHTARRHPVKRSLRIWSSGLSFSRGVATCGVAVAAVLLGVIAYVRPKSERPIHEAVTTPLRPKPAILAPASTRVTERRPVRVANPFDYTEIFEFPPGTSVTEARHSVADLLIKRARARLHKRERTAAISAARATAR